MQLSSFINWMMDDADNIDITSRENEGETIFYDAIQAWQKIEG